jgi:hypothetical protein
MGWFNVIRLDSSSDCILGRRRTCCFSGNYVAVGWCITTQTGGGRHPFTANTHKICIQHVQYCSLESQLSPLMQTRDWDLCYMARRTRSGQCTECERDENRSTILSEVVGGVRTESNQQGMIWASLLGAVKPVALNKVTWQHWDLSGRWSGVLISFQDGIDSSLKFSSICEVKSKFHRLMF